MNRHELGDQIAQETLEKVPEDANTALVLQKRPYTAVQIAYFFLDHCYWAVGFSKINWTDKWDEQYGLEMAVKKAAHDIARQICEAGELVPEGATQ